VSYDQAPRHRALAVEGLALVIVLILAAPAARRRRGLEVVDETDAAEPREGAHR
jgi:hypothetical protein